LSSHRGIIAAHGADAGNKYDRILLSVEGDVRLLRGTTNRMRGAAAKGISMSDNDELLEYARRYFAAAAQSADRRKMQLLVSLGSDYLKLAARREQPRGRRRKEPKDVSGEKKPRAARDTAGDRTNLRKDQAGAQPDPAEA
jgi:hypothetical protein